MDKLSKIRAEIRLQELQTLQDIEDYMDALPEDAPQGWISVKDALPEIEQEVIVLSDVFNGVYRKGTNVISFGHRPNPEGYIAKSTLTGKVKHYAAVTYDGWNIPGVTHWMPCPELPDDNEK